MYEIVFYKDKNGKSDIEEYLQKLHTKKDKDSRIKLNKITAYIDLLANNGIKIGELYIKHIKDNIWELRPIRDRILFGYFDNNRFILLSIFVKKTQKTPEKEIKNAQKRLKEFIRKDDNNE